VFPVFSVGLVDLTVDPLCRSGVNLIPMFQSGLLCRNPPHPFTQFPAISLRKQPLSRIDILYIINFFT